MEAGLKGRFVDPAKMLRRCYHILIWRRESWLEPKAIGVVTLTQQLRLLRLSFHACLGILCLEIIIFIIKWLTLVKRCNVLLQISQLRKRFAAVLALEGPATVMLTVVILNIATLLECDHASFEQTLEMCPELVGCGVMNSNYLYHVWRNILKLVFKVLSYEQICLLLVCDLVGFALGVY